MSVNISTIFDIEYGNQFDLSKMEVSNDNDSIHFISRASTNNGLVAKVKKYDDIEPYKAGAITVTMGGSYLLSSFVQLHTFYTAQNIKVLVPKCEMSLDLKLLYCAFIQHNRYKYHSHAREANSTFDELFVPSLEEAKNILHSFNRSIKDIENQYPIKPLMCYKNTLDTDRWKWFSYDELFTIHHGYYNKKPLFIPKGDIPFLGATDSNNGVTGYTSLNIIDETSKTGAEPNDKLEKKIFKNCIAVTNNGSVGYAYYHPETFTCSHDVTPLSLKDKYPPLNKYTALFLCTLIEKERYRWIYGGRKWRPKRMPTSMIKLPILQNGNPDWTYMENFIKSLQFSKNI